MLLAPVQSIPSPSWSGFSLGPLEIHAYALCILVGIGIAVAVTSRRWAARGQDPEFVLDAVLLAVPLGIIGARLYHVLITDPGYYFGSAEGLAEIPRLWEGGLGIMGAVALGAVGVWIMCRSRRASFALFADCAAPALLIAQALGRWGNWFNQELFGRPTTLPWGLEIAPWSPNFPDGVPVGTLFHPTFLYESLWNLLGAAVLIWLSTSRRTAHRVDGGRTFALYLIWYGIGRFLIEVFLRIDPSAELLGIRIHVFTAAALILLGILLFAWLTRRRARILGETESSVRSDSPRRAARSSAAAPWRDDAPEEPRRTAPDDRSVAHQAFVLPEPSQHSQLSESARR